MAQRGRPRGSGAKASLSMLAMKQLEYLQLVQGRPRIDIMEALIDHAFKVADGLKSGKLSAALNAELEAKAKSDALKAELMPKAAPTA